jgi:hypothetical protein
MIPNRESPRFSSCFAPRRAAPPSVLLSLLLLALAGGTDAQDCEVAVVNNYNVSLDTVYTFDGGDDDCAICFEKFSVAAGESTSSRCSVGPHSESLGRLRSSLAHDHN